MVAFCVAVDATLAALYARYSRSVFRRARTLLGDSDAAKDATQEVFLRVMRAEPGDGFGEEPMAWLYRTTTNLCLNSLRDVKRRGELLTERRGDDTSKDNQDARILVRRILAQVPEDLQEVAIYHYVDELSQAEIAEILGVSRRTIGNRLASFHSLVGELVAREQA